jgi:hypothetical protein
MSNKMKKIIFFLTSIAGITIQAMAIDYTPRVDVKYMFEDDAESVHTLTTDSIFAVGKQFYLVIDITISVPNSKLPIFAQKSINCGISFYSPQIVNTDIVQGGGSIHIDDKYKPNRLYAFKVPVQPTIVGTDNKPVSIAPSTIRIRCEPIATGKQEIHIVFDRIFIDKGYNKIYVITINAK